MAELDINLPKKLDFLLGKQARYKVLRGGRGSAKSWSIARALLVRGMKSKTRILCARELQKSVRDSVHQLLSDQITALSLGSFYTIQSTAIIGRNGTEFGFAGLRHNIAELKSYEGADIVWVEEAQVVSRKSWEVLIPTIRKEGSEIWVSFNPELEDDETYKRFILSPPGNAIVVTMNWQDNPWFPSVLMTEMEEKKIRDPDGYLHIWEGHCRSMLDGAIYAKELRQAKLESRITDVPYDPLKPVHTFWDLGWNSVTGKTAITMAQNINGWYHVIDYMEDSEHTVNWYVAELQKKPYVWGKDYLPHDAENTNIAAGGRTVKKIMETLGRKTVVLPRRPVDEGINAARTLFPVVKIDHNKCGDLLQCLNRYRYEVDEETGLRSKKPEDSVYSHGADSFRYFAMGVQEDKTKPVEKKERRVRTSELSMFGAR
jgi:phage terminase large subunit